MPRVGGGRAAAKTTTSKDKLDRCLEALLSAPDAACLGGGEMCCGGCGDGSELVAGVCAFVSANPAAARRFVARGGLEVVSTLVCKPLRSSSSQAGPGPGSTTYWGGDEEDAWGGESSDASRCMGALAILQALTGSKDGQNLVLQRRPELLQAVCQLASPDDADDDGDLRHAALQLLIGWHSGRVRCGDGITRWLHQRGRSDAGADMLQVALESLGHPMLGARRAAAQLFAEAAVYAASCEQQQQQQEQQEQQQQEQQEQQQQAQQQQQHCLSEPAVAHLSRLCSAVDATLSERDRLVAVPPPESCAHAHAHAEYVRGPLAASLLSHTRASAENAKAQVQGLLELSCALLELPSGADALAEAHGVRVLLRLFCVAWGLPEPQVSLLPPTAGPGGADSQQQQQQQAVFAFSADPSAAASARRIAELGAKLSGGDAGLLLQEHAVREHALDTLILLLRHPRGLPVIGAAAARRQVPGGGAAQAAAAQLRSLATGLLLRQTPAHTRAALAMLGAVRAGGTGGDDGTSSGTAESLGDLLRVLCQVFDCAWASEGLPLALTFTVVEISLRGSTRV
ncbi:hypothetical protein FOA52_005289 [Chlamydomonas sp. UWO 241]|nr:hypothetical protein FOA52_005289 [Chlamydomonas sp. UWO 241]